MAAIITAGRIIWAITIIRRAGRSNAFLALTAAANVFIHGVNAADASTLFGADIRVGNRGAILTNSSRIGAVNHTELTAGAGTIAGSIMLDLSRANVTAAAAATIGISAGTGSVAAAFTSAFQRRTAILAAMAEAAAALAISAVVLNAFIIMLGHIRAAGAGQTKVLVDDAAAIGRACGFTGAFKTGAAS